MKEICVVTGTRAEYGLLRWVMDGIRRSSSLSLQVIVTGAHLSPEFGLTHRLITEDGYPIHRKVEMLLSSDTPTGVTKSIGLGVIGFADALEDLQPDLILILGDRYELLAVASAALVAGIPIAHLHGGERTEGAFDESIRHAVTKMSHLHFVATKEYHQRVLQLGEDPDRVFLVGALGVDNIDKLGLLDRDTLEQELEFQFGPHNLMVTFHPATLEHKASAAQLKELLKALETLEDTHVIFTMPNSDTGSRKLKGMIEDYVDRHYGTTKLFTSLGQLRYLSCLQFVDGVVGNSSSGLIEAPALKKGTINIGDRQKGRLKANSVIDCRPEKAAIKKALETLYSDAFQRQLPNVANPYGSGGAAEAIVRILDKTDFSRLKVKRFHDWR
jgi:GDP/UDP-N,N'-diacetylbacillosamine 2-epimerase (hydrolysing)